MQEGHDRAEHWLAFTHDLKITMAEHDPTKSRTGPSRRDFFHAGAIAPMLGYRVIF